MTPEQSLREKLRKIEALFAGAATEGEKVGGNGRGYVALCHWAVSSILENKTHRSPCPAVCSS